MNAFEPLGSTRLFKQDKTPSKVASRAPQTRSVRKSASEKICLRRNLPKSIWMSMQKTNLKE